MEILEMLRLVSELPRIGQTTERGIMLRAQDQVLFLNSTTTAYLYGRSRRRLLACLMPIVPVSVPHAISQIKLIFFQAKLMTLGYTAERFCLRKFGHSIIMA